VEEGCALEWWAAVGYYASLQLPKSRAPFPEGGFPISKSQMRKVSLSGGDSPSARQVVVALSMSLLAVAAVSASRARRHSAALSRDISVLVPTFMTTGPRPSARSL
jgi:hypothetical protein